MSVWSVGHSDSTRPGSRFAPAVMKKYSKEDALKGYDVGLYLRPVPVSREQHAHSERSC